MKESEGATIDAYIQGEGAVLEVFKLRVEAEQAVANGEVRSSLQKLASETDPNRRAQLHSAFAALKDRSDDLEGVANEIKGGQARIELLGSGKMAIDAASKEELSNVEVAEAVWTAAERLKLIPPWAVAAKTAVDAWYGVAVQAASVLRVNQLNENAERYLAAVKSLHEAMQKAVVTRG